MVKKFQVIGLDCPSCATKLERKLQKIDGVQNLTINFLFNKMTIESRDDQFETVLAKIRQECAKFEGGVKIV